VLKAAEHFGIDSREVYLDASSFHVHGQYEAKPRQSDVFASEEMPSIEIAYGYSRRPLSSDLHRRKEDEKMRSYGTNQDCASGENTKFLAVA
jgi:hypothetical protein